MTRDAPISDREFDRLIGDMMQAGQQGPLAVACSGGPDSMALAFLLAGWCRANGRPLTALVVDHRLRPDSTDEALMVADRLGQLGIAAEILTWTGEKPSSDIQNKAREARYERLTGWCRAQHGADLFLGHHLDDQAETFMLRLARGSGVDGLAAMARLELRNGIRLLRPLLDMPKARLVATLKAAGIDYVSDPSNLREKFARNRMRKLMPALAGEGADAGRLAETARHMARARAALEHYTNDHLARSGRIHPLGYAWLNRETFLEAPEEIRLRALARLVQALGVGVYPPRFSKLETLLQRLEQGPEPGGATLSGCQIAWRKGRVWLAREQSVIEAARPMAADGTLIWDGRFSLTMSKAPEPGCRIAALGAEGWRQLRGRPAGDDTDLAALPAFVRRGIPALWQGDQLLCPLPVEKSDRWQDYGIERIRLLTAEFFGKTAFSSLVMRTM